MDYFHVFCNNSTIFTKNFYFFNNCSQQSFIFIPFYLCFLIFCSYQLGFNSFFPTFSIFSRDYQTILNLFSSLFLLVIFLIQLIIMIITETIIIFKLAMILKMITIFIYLLLNLKYSLMYSQTNHSKLRYLFLVTIICLEIFECFVFYSDAHNRLTLAFFIISCICWIIHCWLILIQNIFQSSYSQMLTNSLSIDSNLILKCDEYYFWISQLLFTWVSPLLDKGARSGIHSIEDLFELPNSLSSYSLDQFVEIYLRAELRKSLIRSIFSQIYLKLFFLAFLKLFADALTISFPIFLNYLLLYLDTDNIRSKKGFIFALYLLINTLLNAICISFYNFQMSKISLQFRTLLITLIYNKLLRVRSTTLINNFGTGQILNLANTDIERVINLVPSLFQFISLPIQLLVTLYLLYIEIKFSFLSGLLFIILLIPINKLICNKITILSQKMMMWKDRRIKIMSEILKGIRAIKIHNWEQLFMEKVLLFRKREVKYLKLRKYLDALCVYFWATTPVIISSLVFATYIYFNGNQSLTSSKVFTTLALLGMLIMPLNAFPWVLNGLLESLVSLKRLNLFYVLAEIDLNRDFDLIEKENETIFQLDNCSFTYVDEEQISRSNNFNILDIDIKIFKGMLVGLTGKVGSGKSSLIKSLLNEMNKINGTFKVNQLCQQGIGYVPQEPWIQNNTIRENILFGKEYDSELYNQIINACELVHDFQFFPKRDQTMIGNHGATLSGGQKSRITLARALYQNFEIYLIDEPFASIDRNVAQRIYQKCFQNILKNKCVILVTNHIEYLQNALMVLYLDNGKITRSVPSTDLYQENLDEYDGIENEQSEQEIMIFDKKENVEEREHGTIKSSVYFAYISSIGYGIFFTIIIFICLMQISRSASDFWLSLWTKNKNSSSFDNLKYLYVFILIGVLNSMITLIRAFIFAYGGVRAAIKIHNSLLNSIFKSSLLFFDLISFGIIMNRFSSDTFNADDALPFTLNIFLAQLSSLLISLVIIIYGMPWTIVVFIFLIIPYYLIQEHFRTTSRELKRISATTLSPIYSQLNDTIQGLTVIRSFGQMQRFKKEFYEKVNIYNRVQYAINALQQWLNLRLQFIGSIVTSSVAFIAVFLHYYSDKNQQEINSSLIGLSLVYSLSLTSLLNGCVQSFTQTELDLISVERIKQLIKKLTEFHEDDRNLGLNNINEEWPNKGVICFSNVSMRYRDDLDCALKNISFEIKSGEHVAIVGRTGSGKSSIFQVLFRLVNIHSGSIIIDGIDIQNIDLKILRSRIYMIPQDAFMFNGTIRENIDPLNRYRDDEIWNSLFDCKINILVDSLGGLDVELHENGKDLSIGQRHLFYLARAVLNKKKILCIDEITANVDKETCAIVNELMRTIFKETTVLHIAHRVDAIQDCHRIIMMNEGSIMEIYSFEQYASNHFKSVL